MSADTSSAIFSQLWRVALKLPHGLATRTLELRAPSEGDAWARAAVWAAEHWPEYEMVSISRQGTPR